MTMQNPCQELATRFDRLATEGLVDVKFFLDPSDAATKTSVCSEVNRLFAAVDTDAAYILDFKDSSRQ